MVDELGNINWLYLSISCLFCQPYTYKKPLKSLNLNGLSMFCRFMSYATSGAGGIRTLVQTRKQSAFFMLSFILFVRNERDWSHQTQSLTSKVSKRSRSLSYPISDLPAPPYQIASEPQHPGDVLFRHLVAELSVNLLYFGYAARA